MKKQLPLWLKGLSALLALGLVLCVWEFFSSQNPYILPLKRALKYEVLRLSPVDEEAETAGLAPGFATQRWENGGLSADGVFDVTADNKVIYQDGTTARLVNYPDGWQMDFPAGTTFDFSLSPLFVRAEGAGFDAVISRETATYASTRDVITFELSTLLPFLFRDETVKAHADHYEYRFLTDPNWQAANRVSVSRWTGERGSDYVLARLQEPGDIPYDGYLYATVYTGSRDYIRVMFRFNAGDDELRRTLYRGVEGMRLFDPAGTGVYQTDFAPDLPENWSAETADLFASIAGSGDLRWGIFTGDIYESGIETTVPQLEAKLDHTFDLILAYTHFSQPFPTEFMERCRREGRLVELTYQITANNNTDLTARTPFLNLCRGELDREIRAFARQAAQWGHPFLFRLNNEMNSDWTSYSGVVNMADPRLFVDLWQRIFRIFREEGADNCIWIWNPNDRSAPPSRWNEAPAYYPGNEYVQLLGVTGYNNGTYYTQWAEEWREFDQIYDEIQNHYSPHFASFPWIITEFACSGIGGDKAAWIDNMFARLGDYPNIKMAVWFSYADFDGDTPARTYWLDETEATTEAFRRGLAG